MSRAQLSEEKQIAHIVATGVRSPVGLDSASAAAAIRAGISLLAEHPFLTDEDGNKVVCAREPTLDPHARGPRRIGQLTLASLREVAAKLSAQRSLPCNLQVLLALPESRPGFSQEDAQRMRRSLTLPEFPGTTVTFNLIGEGHAGALLALSAAVGEVVSGRFELLIAGGVDSYLEPSTIAWLEQDRRLAKPGIRAGFPPGEAAALLAIASETARQRLGLASHAVIRGIGCCQEERDPVSDIGMLGEALTEAVLHATSGLQSPSELITDVYGDINGERGRTEDWGFTLLRTGTRFRDGTDCVSTAAQCGDVGAATAALGCALAAEAWRMSRARGSLALVWAGSWAGLRGAILLQDSGSARCLR